MPWSSSTVIGSLTTTHVPSPEELSIVIVPPIASTRSCRPMRPVPAPGSAPPTPSSRIMSVGRAVICRHVHVPGRGVRMFGGVREGRRADVVGRYLDLVGKRPFDMRVEIDRHRRTARKSHESRCQPALGQDRRVNTACTRSTGACPRAIRRGYADLLRIFDPNDAAYHEFVGGWVLAEVVDAARQVDGNREVVDGILGEWSVVAADTGAPHLEVQLRYTKAVLAHGNAEPLYEDAISVAGRYTPHAHIWRTAPGSGDNTA